MENTKEVHYVCAGTCGGMSDHPQNCETQGCTFYGQPMQKCDCEDGSHRASIPGSPVPAQA
jgi:hypothetical protein